MRCVFNVKLLGGRGRQGLYCAISKALAGEWGLCLTHRPLQGADNNKAERQLTDGRCPASVNGMVERRLCNEGCERGLCKFVSLQFPCNAHWRNRFIVQKSGPTHRRRSALGRHPVGKDRGVTLM